MIIVMCWAAVLVLCLLSTHIALCLPATGVCWCHCCLPATSAIATIYFGIVCAALHVRPIHKLYWGLFFLLSFSCVQERTVWSVFVWNTLRFALVAFHFYFPSCTDYNVLLKVCRAKVIECVQNQSLTDRNVRAYKDICENIYMQAHTHTRTQHTEIESEALVRSTIHIEHVWNEISVLFIFGVCTAWVCVDGIAENGTRTTMLSITILRSILYLMCACSKPIAFSYFHLRLFVGSIVFSLFLFLSRWGWWFESSQIQSHRPCAHVNHSFHFRNTHI